MADLKNDRELEEALRKLQGKNRTARKAASDLRLFFIGLVMLGAGLYWLFQRTTVSTMGIFGSGLRLGGWMIPSGTVIIPFFIGILLLFFMEKRIFGWIVTAIGLAIIVLAIIMSVRIHFERTSLFDFVMMFFLIGGGSGLLLRVLFRPREE